MEDEIGKILDEKENTVKDFTSFEFSDGELAYINTKLSRDNRHVHFINWNPNQKFEINLKQEIERKLLKNIFSDKRNELVIDLSKCKLDLNYFKQFVNDIRENSRNIGAVILSESDEVRFKDDADFKELMQILEKNNEKNKRYPSDYEHALLTYHCNKRDNQEVNRELETLGWKEDRKFKAEEEFLRSFESTKLTEETKEYLSVLYKNESKRCFVLVFRGLKLEFFSDEMNENGCLGGFIKGLQSTFKNLVPKDTALEAAVYGLLGGEMTTHSYHAYAHSTTALEISEEHNFYLSFTGCSFGAWLAEQSVFFCKKQSPAAKVSAITFESPGSLEIIATMDANFLVNNPQSNLNKYVKTFLFEPNFLNTCNKHVGQVFEMSENYTDRDKQDLKEILVKASIPEKIFSKLLETLTEIFLKFKGMLNFFINGLRALFSLDLRWLLDQFDSSTGQLKTEIKKAKSWPKSEFHPRRDSFKASEIIEKIPVINIIPKEVIGKIERPLMRILENSFPIVLTIGNILTELVSGNLDIEQACSYIEYREKTKVDNNIKQKEILKQNNKNNFMLLFVAHYDTYKFNAKEEYLSYFDPTYVDKRIYDFSNNSEPYLVGQLKVQFLSLKNKFKLIKEGEDEKLIKIKSESEVTIDQIRDHFIRLEKIYEVCQERNIPLRISEDKNQTNQIDKDSKTIRNDFGGMRLETYLETKKDQELLNRIDELLNEKSFAYIFGSSGNGKTTMAREYAFRKSHKYLIQFVNSNDYKSNLSELADRFLTKKEIYSSTNDQDLISNIKKQLENRTTLFIFDDVQSKKDVKNLIDSFNEHKFLITTKKLEVYKGSDIKSELGVEKESFSQEDCFKYLELLKIDTKEKKNDWEKFIQSCVQEMNFSIKDFEGAIDFFRNHYFCTFDDILEIFKNKSFKNLRTIEKENKKAYDLLTRLEYLEKSNLDFETMRIVSDETEFLSESLKYLINNGFLKLRCQDYGRLKVDLHEKTQSQINDELTKKERKDNKIENVIENINKNVKKQAADQEGYEELIKKLNKHVKNIGKDWENKEKSKMFLSLDKRLTEICESFYRRDRGDEKKEEKEEDKIQPITNINTTNIINNYSDPLQRDLFNLEFILKRQKKEKPRNNLSIAKTLKEIAALYYENKISEKALEHYQKSYNLYQSHEHLDQQSIAEIQNSIGQVYLQQGNYDKALILFKRSLKIQRKQKTTNETLLALTLHNIGKVFLQQKKFQTALEYLCESLELKKKEESKDEKSIAMILNDMGRAYLYQKNFHKALDFLNDALGYMEKIKPIEKIDREMTLTLNEIGQAYFGLKNYKNSLEIYDRCLRLIKIRTRMEKQDTQLLSEVLNNMGQIYLNSGKFKKAIHFYENSFNLEHKLESKGDKCIAEKLTRFGKVYQKEKDCEKSLECFKKCLEIRQRQQPKDEISIADTLNNIGRAYFNLNNLKEAEKFYNRSLEMKKKQIPRDNKSIAITLNDKAEIFLKKNNFDKALSLLNNSIELQKKETNLDEQMIAITLDTIGQVYSKQKNYHKALKFFRNSLDLKQKQKPTDERNISITLFNIGQVYFIKKNFKESLNHLDKCLEFRRKEDPKDEESISKTLYEIGNVLFAQKIFEKAIVFFREALELEKKQKPVKGQTIAMILSSIGRVYFNQKNFKKALKFFENSLKLKKSNTTDKQSIAVTLFDLAEVYLNLGNYKKAFYFYDNFLNLKYKNKPEDEENIAAKLNDMGHFFLKQNKYEQSLKLFVKCLELKRNKRPRDKQSIAATFSDIARVYFNQNNFDNALKYFQKSLLLKEQQKPIDEQSISTTFYNIGQVYLKLGDYESSLAFFQKSINIQCRQEPTDEQSIAETQNYIGLVYFNLNDFENALKFFNKSLALKEKQNPKDMPSIAQSLHNIGKNYLGEKKFDMALEFFQKSVELLKAEKYFDKVRIASYLNSIGRVHFYKENYKKASSFYKESLSLKQRIKPRDEKSISWNLDHIGKTFFKMKKYSEALEFYQDSLKLKKKQKKIDEASLARTLDDMGLLYLRKENFVKAFKSFKESLELKNKQKIFDQKSINRTEQYLEIVIRMIQEPTIYKNK